MKGCIVLPIVDLYERYNEVTDWGKLKASVSGVILKYTNGESYAITSAVNYVNKCQQYDIPYTGYHFAENGDVNKELEMFLTALDKFGHTLPFTALDFEHANIPSWAQQFCSGLAVPMLYAPSTWLQIIRPDLWSHYTYVWGAGSTGHYSGRYELWQSAGLIDGVSGSADVDTIHNKVILAKGNQVTTPAPDYGNTDKLIDYDDDAKVRFSVTPNQALQAVYGQMFFPSTSKSTYQGGSIMDRLTALQAGVQSLTEQLATVSNSLTAVTQQLGTVEVSGQLILSQKQTEQTA